MNRVLAVAIVCLTVTACKPNEQSAKIGDTTVTADTATGVATMTNADSSVTAMNGAAAAQVQMPEQAPLYPGALMVSSMTTRTAGEATTMVILNTRDTPDKVVAFYRDKLAAAGLEIVGEMITAESASVGGLRDNRKTSAIASRNEDGTTSVLITFPA